MIYFKNSNNDVFAYESVEDKETYGSPKLVEMSAEEVDEHFNSVSATFAESQERSWRDVELIRADIELNKVQDSDPKSKGSVSAWREYRKALRAWPEHQDFPDKSKRPVAPDA